MNGHDKKVLLKLIDHTDHIMEYVSKCEDILSFENNSLVVEACVFNLMQIGELAHSELSAEAKESLTNIPWKEIYGMRNRIVHGYSEVSMDVVWETIRDDIPVLRAELKSILDEE